MGIEPITPMARLIKIGLIYLRLLSINPSPRCFPILTHIPKVSYLICMVLYFYAISFSIFSISLVS